MGTPHSPVESGAEIAALTDQLTKRSAERAGLQAQLRGENSAERLTVLEMEKAWPIWAG